MHLRCSILEGNWQGLVLLFRFQATVKMTDYLIRFVEDGEQKDTVVPSNWVVVGVLYWSILLMPLETLRIEWLYNQIG